VAIHLKGSAGSFRPVEDKPALTLNFDKFAPGQRFHGLKKIHLNNSVQDSSYLSEQISRELFLAAGVPTTRATQAKVQLNGRNLGVCVLVEGWNKQFLKRHFNKTTACSTMAASPRNHLPAPR
jgi:spore coat protein CotH